MLLFRVVLLTYFLSFAFSNAYEKPSPPVLKCVWDEGDYLKNFETLMKKGPYNTEYCLFFFSCPSFAGDPYSQESLKLKKDYLLARDIIINYYKGKDFLEATLSLLAGFSP